MSALGMIETKGLVGLIVAADACVKAAKVEILSRAKIGSALTTIFVRGDVASCQNACEAGAKAASQIGELVAVHVIPQPDTQLKDHWSEIIE
ncbi:MAG: BMC domain-containing protein [Elusimicrobia bacterium]|nr:BMC domain-containing protein [Elusimicrobiota bacterium]